MSVDDETAAEALNRVAEVGGFDDLLAIKDPTERAVWLTARVADFVGDADILWMISGGDYVEHSVGPIAVEVNGRMISRAKKGIIQVKQPLRISFRKVTRASAR